MDDGVKYGGGGWGKEGIRGQGGDKGGRNTGKDKIIRVITVKPKCQTRYRVWIVVFQFQFHHISSGSIHTSNHY